jgi:hypothetical protein
MPDTEVMESADWLRTVLMGWFCTLLGWVANVPAL